MHTKYTELDASGAIHFITNYVKTIHPVNGEVQVKLFPCQETMIKEICDNEKIVIMGPRQIGKTLIAAAYLLYYAMFNSDKNIFIISKTSSDSFDIMARIRFMFDHLPPHGRVKANEISKKRMVFDNGCKIIAVPMTPCAMKGHTIDCLFVDELAFANVSYANELFDNISPSLSIGAKVIIASTPRDVNDVFGRVWMSAINGNEFKHNRYHYIKIDLADAPYYSESFVENTINNIGVEKFSMEYLCLFNKGNGGV